MRPRLLTFTVAGAAVTALTLAAGSAASAAPGPAAAHAPTTAHAPASVSAGTVMGASGGSYSGAAGDGWHHGRTCTPQATLWGWVPGQNFPYLVDNDQFAGAAGRSCLQTTDGHNFRVLNNTAPWRGVVTRFPQVRVGPFDRSRDPGSGFPYEVKALPDLIVHADMNGAGVPGAWLGEVHMWLYNSAAVRGPGTIELVLIMQHHDWVPYYSRCFRVSRLRVCGNDHKAGPAGHRWPLVVLRLVHPRRHLGLNVRALFYRLRRMRWLGPDRWLGNVEVGVECASGCKGFYASMTVDVRKPRRR